MLQRRAANQAEPAAAPSIVHDVLRASGQPLGLATRAFMEPRFGCDFSQVRVHTDAQAAESTRAVNALAYTVGRDVVFGAEQYTPQTKAGQRLLAHELTHVVQQAESAQSLMALRISLPDDSLEREATHNADAILAGASVATQPGVGVRYIQRQAGTRKRQPITPPVAAGPETAAPCPPRLARQLPPILERARFMAFRAFFGLQALLLGGQPRPEVASQLLQQFRLRPDAAEATQVLNVLGNIYTRLSGTSMFHCSAANDPNCEELGAYVKLGDRPIFLCTSFFPPNVADHESPWVLVHEAAHLSGARADHARFFTFGAIPTCDEFGPLTSSQALDNADSYAFFAYCVSR